MAHAERQPAQIASIHRAITDSQEAVTSLSQRAPANAVTHLPGLVVSTYTILLAETTCDMKPASPLENNARDSCKGADCWETREAEQCGMPSLCPHKISGWVRK